MQAVACAAACIVSSAPPAQGPADIHIPVLSLSRARRKSLLYWNSL